MSFTIITIDEFGAASEGVRSAFDDGTPVWVADANGHIHGLVIAVPEAVREAYWQQDVAPPRIELRLNGKPPGQAGLESTRSEL